MYRAPPIENTLGTEVRLLFEYDFKPHYFDLLHGRLHYLDEGEGRVVVLVHGNPTWSYYFRNLVRVLSCSFRVIVPDHLGCGLSDKPQDFNYILDNHINNLVLLLEHLEVDTCSMVVHDWGGPIGLGAVADGGVELEKLAILNTAAFRSSRIPFRIRICRWPVIGRMLVQGLNGFSGAAIFMAVEKKMDAAVAKGYLKPYDSWNNRRAVYEFVKDIPLTPKDRSYPTLVRIEDSLTKLSQSKIPTAIYWGGKDFCFNDHFYTSWRDRFPRASRHYFEDWGHYVLEDGKGQIEPLIEKFLLGKSAPVR